MLSLIHILFQHINDFLLRFFLVEQVFARHNGFFADSQRVCTVKVKAFANADGNSAARVMLQALTDAYATGFARTTSFPEQGYGRLNVCFRDRCV